MKNLFAALGIFILSSLISNLFGQAPEGFVYQAEIRNDKGRTLSNTDVSLDIRILNQSDDVLDWVWNRIYDVTTDKYGMVSVIVEDAEPATNPEKLFSVIKWGEESHYLYVEVNDGTGYIPTGNPVLIMSIPYSLYANKSGYADHAGNAINTDNLEYGDIIQYTANGFVAAEFKFYYPDADGDNYGAESGAVVYSPVVPPFYASNVGDCDDDNPAINIGAEEICDGIDNNCDGQIDEICDEDGDGFYANEDCNDNDPNVFPGATEICGDGIDQNCDKEDFTSVPSIVTVEPNIIIHHQQSFTPLTLTGEKFLTNVTVVAIDGTPFPVTKYVSEIEMEIEIYGLSSGYHEITVSNGLVCTTTLTDAFLVGYDSDRDGFLAEINDCNDLDATINPEAPEICDGVDNNCNGFIDKLDVSSFVACSLPDNVVSMDCLGALGCVIEQCASGWSDCNGDPSDGCETNIASNIYNCGGCGINCNLPHATSVCVSGMCEIGQCDIGWADCDGIASNGCEVNLNNYVSISGAINLGNHCGDNGEIQIANISGVGQKYYRVYLTECSSSIHDLTFRANLNVPSSVNYNLLVFNSNGQLIGKSENVGNDSVFISIDDTFVVDDNRDIYVKVEYAGGNTCDKWTLNLIGGGN